MKTSSTTPLLPELLKNVLNFLNRLSDGKHLPANVYAILRATCLALADYDGGGANT